MSFHFLDRRRHPRHRASFPVGIDAPARPPQVGMSFDLSRSGLLAFSDSRFDRGERLALRLRMGDAREVQVQGTVVRVAPRCSDVRWRWALAVLFDQELPDGVPLAPEPLLC